MLKKYGFLILLLSACASDTYIPVNSSSLVDTDRRYADDAAINTEMPAEIVATPAPAGVETAPATDIVATDDIVPVEVEGVVSDPALAKADAKAESKPAPFDGLEVVGTMEVLEVPKVREDRTIAMTADNYSDAEVPAAAPIAPITVRDPNAPMSAVTLPATLPPDWRSPPPAPAESDFDIAVREAETRQGGTAVQAPSRPSRLPPGKSRDRDATVTILPVAGRAVERKLNVEPLSGPATRSIEFLSTVVYHSNSLADMSARDIAALRSVASKVREKDGSVKIVGHASSRTRDMRDIDNKLKNFDLSMTRAKKVRDELVRLGVPANRIYLAGVSDTERILEEKMPAREAANRRTEIYIRY